MFSLNQGIVTFKKGAKPQSIKSVQKQVRDTYLRLCAASAPREDAIARMQLFRDLNISPGEAYAAAPYFKHVVDSGVRAYCRAGEGLAKFRTMYSMDVMIPANELSFYVDMPKELIDQVREAGLNEVKIKAQES